jgi:hypothetical protein
MGDLGREMVLPSYSFHLQYFSCRISSFPETLFTAITLPSFFLFPGMYPGSGRFDFVAAGGVWWLWRWGQA